VTDQTRQIKRVTSVTFVTRSVINCLHY
jgi:hypothetical protein